MAVRGENPAATSNEAPLFVIPSPPQPSLQPQPPITQYLPPAPAGTKRLFACSLGTGFVGTFEEVQAHEQRILAQQAAGWGTVQGTVQVPAGYPGHQMYASQAAYGGGAPPPPFYNAQAPYQAGAPQWR